MLHMLIIIMSEMMLLWYEKLEAGDGKLRILGMGVFAPPQKKLLKNCYWIFRLGVCYELDVRKREKVKHKHYS